MDIIVKNVLHTVGFHRRKSSNRRLYLRRKESGRVLQSFKQVYDILL